MTVPKLLWSSSFCYLKSDIFRRGISEIIGNENSQQILTGLIICKVQKSFFIRIRGDLIRCNVVKDRFARRTRFAAQRVYERHCSLVGHSFEVYGCPVIYDNISTVVVNRVANTVNAQSSPVGISIDPVESLYHYAYLSGEFNTRSRRWCFNFTPVFIKERYLVDRRRNAVRNAGENKSIERIHLRPASPRYQMDMIHRVQRADRFAGPEVRSSRNADIGWFRSAVEEKTLVRKRPLVGEASDADMNVTHGRHPDQFTKRSKILDRQWKEDLLIANEPSSLAVAAYHVAAIM